MVLGTDTCNEIDVNLRWSHAMLSPGSATQAVYAAVPQRSEPSGPGRGWKSYAGSSRGLQRMGRSPSGVASGSHEDEMAARKQAVLDLIARA
jgi:hypothetical protein